jgi:HlyD family secretion protein
VEEQRVNVILHLQAPEEGPPLGHGFRVDARVVVAEQNDALRVPTDALVRDGRDWAVFVLESGRAHLTPVTIGAGGEDYRAVTQGLELGQRVVLFPGDSLADGARIRSAR